MTAQILNNVNERVSSLVMTCRQRPRDRPSSIGLALHPYLLNTANKRGRSSLIPFELRPLSLPQSASIQVTKRDGKLIVVSSMANATKTTTYELSADGRQLQQTVDMSGGRLPTPIQFTNTYIR